MTQHTERQKHGSSSGGPERPTTSRVVDTVGSPHAAMAGVPVTAVRLDDVLLEPRRKLNASVSIPHQIEACERTGRLDNFRKAAGQEAGTHQGRAYDDSDVFKVLEAACWQVATEPDEDIGAWIDQTVADIAAAQEEDGYLYTCQQLCRPKRERWQDLTHGHELYCGGHLIQAALAHRRVTGCDTLFDVAGSWADCVCCTFGPHGRSGAPGHPEVETALVELYRETGTRKYLDTAVFFLQQRGAKPPVAGGHPCHQDHKPIREQREVTGHAVRQLYLTAGALDACMERPDTGLLDALQQQWQNFVQRRMYVTGGAGSRYHGSGGDAESFGADYELPNGAAYSETCAAIAAFMAAYRFLLLSGESTYADVMELALYNTILGGVGLDGKSYFYTNPLEHDGQADITETFRGSCMRTTKHWDYTACCPPNVARLLGSLPGYMYAVARDGALAINLYVESEAPVALDDGKTVTVRQRTGYPWDGRVEIDIVPDQAVSFPLLLRIPEWAHSASLTVNGARIDQGPEPGRYARIERLWQPGDRVVLDLPMPVERITAHPRVLENSHRVALKKGPVVFCLEAVDHPEVELFDISLPLDAECRTEHHAELLGGIDVILAQGTLQSHRDPCELYQPLQGGTPGAVPVRAIPYFARANRGRSGFRVWIPMTV